MIYRVCLPGREALTNEGARVDIRIAASCFERPLSGLYIEETATIDTGALPTVVPDELVQQLKLTSIGSTTLRTASQRGIIAPVYLVSLQINGQMVSSAHPVVSLPVGTILLGRWFLRTGAIGYSGHKGRFVLRMYPEEQYEEPLAYPDWMR